MKLKFDPIFNLKNIIGKVLLTPPPSSCTLFISYFLYRFLVFPVSGKSIQPSIAVWIRTVIVLLNSGQLCESSAHVGDG
jgi:hypothetical protein